MKADTLQDDIHNYESRKAPTGQAVLPTYGTTGMGLDLTVETWPTLTQSFMSGGQDISVDEPKRPLCTHVDEVRRLPRTFLNQNPVDLLVLGDLNPEQHAAWLERIKRANMPPQFVFEFWPENSLFSDEGPVSKVQVTMWSNAQFESTCRLINLTQVGGVVDRRWLTVVRYRLRKDKHDLKWPDLAGEVSRPMNNCLCPSGIPYAAYRLTTKPVNKRTATRQPHTSQ
jgi:hypothetical protein